MLGWIARLLGQHSAPAPMAPPSAPPLAGEPPLPDPKPEADQPPEDKSDLASAEVALQRFDVLNRKQQPVGYAFSLRNDALRDRSLRIQRFLDDMLLTQLLRLAPNWPASRAAFVVLDERSLALDDLPQLAKLNGVLIVGTQNADRAPAEDIASALRTLQRAGVRIALDAAVGTPWFEALAYLADYFVLRFGTRPPAELKRLAQHLADRHAFVSRLAFDVASLDDLDLAVKLGCEAVTGPFTRMPRDWRGNHIAPDHLRVAALLTRIGEHSDNREIAAALKQDVALSYRLLRYVNASASGLSQSVGSIEQGLLVMGRQQLYRWLSLLFFSTLNKTAANNSLMESALTRGRMMETLGSRLAVEAREDLFVLGLFSMLDLMMQVPMETALAPLNLTPPMRQALLEQNGPYADYLAVARACENGALDVLMKTCAQLGTRPIVANSHHLEALAWVHAIEQQPEAELTL